jgi:hypothetical protein
MPTNITPELLAPYLKGTKFHSGFKETVKAYMDLKVHMDGDYPKEIIDNARPSEPDHIKEYRKKIFAHISMPACLKVEASLMKIRKSEDWMIRYDEKAVNNPLIRKGETLQDYMEKKLPFFQSLTNYIFNFFGKQQDTDANAVVAVMPIDPETPSSDYRRPFPFLFNSPQVIQFVEDDYCILKSADKAIMKIDGGYQLEGDVYFVIDTQFIQRWEQSESDRGFTLKWQIDHGFGEMPAWKVGGVSWKALDGNFLWKSAMSPMVPFLNEAVREYSDLQAGVVQHLFLERWEIEGGKCKTCSGTGRVLKDGSQVKCPNKNCDGGTMIRSPYQSIVIRKGLPGENPVPNPPAGYIDRNPDIIRLQDERVDKHIYKALAAINMEFLDKVPMAESGVAKSVDKDDANNFAHFIAELRVQNMDRIYYFSALWRYIDLIKDKDKIKAMCPVVPVPEKFDLFTSAMLALELSGAKTAKISPVLIKAMEVEYSAKKFSADPEVKAEVELVLNLDPLPGSSADEKASMLMNKGVSEENYVISCNISGFVKRAMEEDEKFPSYEHSKQMEKLSAYAGEVIEANKASSQILDRVVIGEGDEEGEE